VHHEKTGLAVLVVPASSIGMNERAINEWRGGVMQFGFVELKQKNDAGKRGMQCFFHIDS
jgi:hypothetical protein